MIPIKIHGYLDYSLAVLLILLPFLFDFPNGAETDIPIILGTGTLIYSLMTKYELGPFKLIPMKIHLWIDFFAGIFLIAAPRLFSFADEVIWPFIILGVVEVGAALLTNCSAS